MYYRMPGLSEFNQVRNIFTHIYMNKMWHLSILFKLFKQFSDFKKAHNESGICFNLFSLVYAMSHSKGSLLFILLLLFCNTWWCSGNTTSSILVGFFCLCLGVQVVLLQIKSRLPCMQSVHSSPLSYISCWSCNYFFPKGSFTREMWGYFF